MHHKLNQSHQKSAVRGFTLVELISVIIIIGILSATALPKFISLSTDARIAAINAMTGAVHTAAFQWHGICQLKRQECNTANTWPNTLTAQGLSVQFSYDFPEAGDNIDSMQIDILLTHDGFTIDTPSNIQTRFSLDSAPTPQNCSVTYRQALTGDTQPIITKDTTGC